MVIGIVDDESIWVEIISKCIEDYFLLTDNKDYEIVKFSSGKELMKSFDKIELLFLDVELNNNENGFDVAEQLQENKCECKICFLTSHIEFARVGYRVNAFRYIDKLHLDEIDEALAAYITNVAKSEYIICKAADGTEWELNIANVLYIEKNSRKIVYHMADGNEYFNEGNLKDIANQYKKIGIIQIQRSYAVNMRYIRSYDSRQLTMIGGTGITISRDKLQEFKKEFFEWRRSTVN